MRSRPRRIAPPRPGTRCGSACRSPSRADGARSRVPPSRARPPAAASLPAEARCRAASRGDDRIGLQVLELHEVDVARERWVNPVVRDLVLVTPHVRAEAVAVAPVADHQELTRIAVGLPHLQPEETVEVVNETRASAERGDKLVRALGRNAEPRDGYVRHGRRIRTSRGSRRRRQALAYRRRALARTSWFPTRR